MLLAIDKIAARVIWQPCLLLMQIALESMCSDNKNLLLYFINVCYEWKAKLVAS